jgi:hypothetical protein
MIPYLGEGPIIQSVTTSGMVFLVIGGGASENRIRAEFAIMGKQWAMVGYGNLNSCDCVHCLA